MKTSQKIISDKRTRDFGAPEDLRIDSLEQLRQLLSESVKDTRKGYTITEAKSSLNRSRKRAVAT